MNRFKEGSGPDAGPCATSGTHRGPDATTVIVTFTAADPAFLNYLTRTAGLVMSPARGGERGPPRGPVGSGPYTLDVSATVTETSYLPPPRRVLEPRRAALKQDRDARLPGPTAMLNALRAGEINYAKLAVADTFEQAEAAGWTLNKNELDFQGPQLARPRGHAGSRARRRPGPPGDQPRDRSARAAPAVALGYGTVTRLGMNPTTSAAYDDALDERFP